MNRQTGMEPAGVVCGLDDRRKPAMEAHLAGRGMAEAKWFAPGNLHDLDRAVRRGEICHVLFHGLTDLLDGVWEEEIALEEWPAGVRIEFVEPTGDEAFRDVAGSWRRWRVHHRRRQAFAGLVLSLLVLALSFCLCVLLAR